MQGLFLISVIGILCTLLAALIDKSVTEVAIVSTVAIGAFFGLAFVK